MKTVSTKGKRYQYLQIVENSRQDGRTRQRIVGNLGRLDQLVDNGDLERVITQRVEHGPGVRILRA